MGAALVVVVDPVWQGLCAGVGGGVFEGVGPLTHEGLVEALDLAVGPWRVGACADVLDRSSPEQLPEGLALGVGERVVGHQPLADDSLLQEPVQSTAGERGDRGGGLISVDLGVGQP